MSSTPPNESDTTLFSGPSTPESPWADRPFVIKSVRSAPSVSDLDPIPAAKNDAKTPTRSFERPPHPLLKSNAALSPLPIASPVSKARRTPLTVIGKVPE